MPWYAGSWDKGREKRFWPRVNPPSEVKGKSILLFIWQRKLTSRSTRRWSYFGLPGERCKEIRTDLEDLSHTNTGWIYTFSNFSLSFQNWGSFFFFSYKERWLVHVAAHAQAGKITMLAAALYYTDCSGWIDQHAHDSTAWHSLAKSLLSAQSFRWRAQTQKGEAFPERKNNTLLTVKVLQSASAI